MIGISVCNSRCTAFVCTLYTLRNKENTLFHKVYRQRLYTCYCKPWSGWLHIFDHGFHCSKNKNAHKIRKHFNLMKKQIESFFLRVERRYHKCIAEFIISHGRFPKRVDRSPFPICSCNWLSSNQSMSWLSVRIIPRTTSIISMSIYKI